MSIFSIYNDLNDCFQNCQVCASKNKLQGLGINLQGVFFYAHVEPQLRLTDRRLAFDSSLLHKRAEVVLYGVIFH